MQAQLDTYSDGYDLTLNGYTGMGANIVCEYYS